jgi:plastocyanin
LTRNAILGAVDSVEAAATAQVSETERSDGTSLWNIFTNSQQDPAPQPGGGTGYLEIMRFVPPSLDIEAGDTVKWTALAPHTVTFPAAGQDPTTIDPFTEPATTDAVYDGTSLYNSALLALGPGAPSTYELTFPDAGTFNYVCSLHQFLGQTGSIVVSAAPEITPPATDHAPQHTGPPGGQLPWLAIGVLVFLAAFVGMAALMVRRR